MPNIQIAEVFKPLFNDNYKDIILKSGRDAGKSKTAFILSGLTAAKYPTQDIIVARASYGSIGDSAYNEIVEVFDSLDAFNGMFEYRKSPLRIMRKHGGTNIYFMGVGGSKDRTKGIKPAHKVSLVIIEEAQELKSKEHLDQTLASLRRRFGDDTRVVIIFNPPAAELHWINVWAKQKANDKDYLIIHPSWKDIVMFLNDRDIKEIIKLEKENKAYYDYMYMGIPSGAEGCVYPMFRKDKHIITPQEYEFLIHGSNIKPMLCVIGGDGAVTRDSTAFTPIIVLNNGQTVVGPIFYHNPKTDGVLGYHQLVSTHLTKWFDAICSMFHLGTKAEIYEANRRGINITILPIYMRIDSAAPDLIRECQFFFSDRANVSAIHKGTILEMVGVCQSSLCNDATYIIDYGGYFSYQRNEFIKRENNLLAEQISMLTWNDKQTGYDPIVPNDVCDSWTYGQYFWYKNIENIAYFDILRANNYAITKINVILNKK